MSRSIKVDILLNLIKSIIISGVCTFLILCISVFSLYYFDNGLYSMFINKYNTDYDFAIFNVVIIFVIFIIIMVIEFMKEMNKITDFIEKLRTNVNLVAEGNLNIDIPIQSQNELGDLANDINKMSQCIKTFIFKERQWEQNKNNLITNISHDLRTPLTSIIGFLNILKSEKYSSKEEYTHYLNIVYNKSNELNEMVDKLFEFTKLTNGDIELKKKSINICELIEQVTTSFIPSFEENKITYSIQMEERKMNINADPILLARVFSNIISNAIKYGKDGKILKITIERFENKMIIKFINYGKKIDEKYIKNIFNRRFRCEEEAKVIEGNGLGLSICKSIIDKHNGNITVSSNENTTEFAIIL